MFATLILTEITCTMAKALFATDMSENFLETSLDWVALHHIRKDLVPLQVPSFEIMESSLELPIYRKEPTN